MEELKPCPFCGSDDLEYNFGTPDREGRPTAIVCAECSAVGPYEYCSEYFEEYSIIATQAWNNRTQNEWISVKEKGNPEIMGKYLVFCKTTDGTSYTDIGFFYGEWDCGPVTHYIDLPQPPETE